MLETTQRKILTTDQNPDGALFLNAAFLHFGDVVVHVDVLSRPENLSELRRKHRATHVFRATRDLVFAVPIIEVNRPGFSGGHFV
jgi:hypothetical protein